MLALRLEVEISSGNREDHSCEAPIVRARRSTVAAVGLWQATTSEVANSRFAPNPQQILSYVTIWDT